VLLSRRKTSNISHVVFVYRSIFYSTALGSTKCFHNAKVMKMQEILFSFSHAKSLDILNSNQSLYYFVFHEIMRQKSK